MSDVPKRKRSRRENGTYAGHGDDPTLASYLSSLFFVQSVPAFLVLAYAGEWADLYGDGAVVPVFAALLVCALVIVAALMARR